MEQPTQIMRIVACQPGRLHLVHGSALEVRRSGPYDACRCLEPAVLESLGRDV